MTEDNTGAVISFEKTPYAAWPHNFFFMDILRAYACVMIVLFHAHSISKSILYADGTGIWTAPIWLYSTVDLFFVMSGFLMVHMSRKLFGSAQGMKVFAAKRAARTPPLYWIYTLITGAILLIVGGTSHTADHVTTERVIASLLFWPIEGGPIIPLGWTLNYEVLFYVLFGVSVYFSFPKAPFILVGALLSLIIAGCLIDFESFPLRFWTDPILGDFIWGVGLGVAYHKGLRLSGAVRILLFVLAAFPILAVDAPFQYGDITRPFTFGLSAALLVAAATLRKVEPTPPLAGRIIAEVGNSAYSLYLTHIITLKAVELVYKKSGLAEMYGPMPYFIIGSMAAVVVGYIAFVVFEKPFTKYLRSRIPNA